MQQTLAETLKLEGIGLHSGCVVNLTIKPAPVNHGIVFKRVDLPDMPEIPTLYSNVVDTRNCTCLGDKNGNIVSTIEHLMAALSVVGIDNALIEVDNQELPIMDGSALVFFEKLSQAGAIIKQNAPRKKLVVKCADGGVVLDELQLSGGKKIRGMDALNGRKIQQGQRFQ